MENNTVNTISPNFQEYLNDMKEEYLQFLKYLKSLPLLNPRQIYSKIESYNYIGQDTGKKALSLLAFRHLKRLKDIYINNISRDDLPPKVNYLLLGPTGCGKTYIIEILFKEIFKLPSVIIDITNYSETGYVGQDVSTILTRLIHQAKINPLLASVGIVCIDEFDKISSGLNNAVFSGGGTTKDVTGIGVQRELLKIIEGTEVIVPLDYGHSTYGEKIVISTKDICFIACGAFTGLKGIINSKSSDPNIGFGRETKGNHEDDIAIKYEQEDVDHISNFQSYGFLPELIARFGRVVPFDPLSKSQLREILIKNVITRYCNEFNIEGIELKVDGKVIDKVVQDCLIRETGARGLISSLTYILEDAAFDAYSDKSIKTIKLNLDKNKKIKHNLSTK